MPSTIRVNLSRMVADACLDWVSCLFLGYEHRGEDTRVLSDVFYFYWTELRSLNKQTDTVRSAQSSLVRTIESHAHQSSGDIRSNGLIARMHEQDWTVEQVSANVVNAMTAAFETTAVILFWTIWNLARTPGAWQTCRQEWGTTACQQNLQKELDTLAMIKATATQGKAVDISSLSYLGRALMETVRVYPPVWTLPRFLPEEQRYAKLDVPWTNQALDRRWDPSGLNTEQYFIASFGVGKRHCPGGTAALFAAHTLLRSFIQKFEAPVECQPGMAVESIYLGPTMCNDGPQFFDLSLSGSVTPT